jgi:hypothetical protein
MAVNPSVVATSERIIFDEDARALLDRATLVCVEQLVDWASANAPNFDLRLEHARVRRWRSLEDPDWIQVVVDLTVAGAVEAALSFWEAAANKLGALAAPGSSAAALLSIRVDWQ